MQVRQDVGNVREEMGERLGRWPTDGADGRWERGRRGVASQPIRMRGGRGNDGRHPDYTHPHWSGLSGWEFAPCNPLNEFKAQ